MAAMFPQPRYVDSYDDIHFNYLMNTNGKCTPGFAHILLVICFNMAMLTWIIIYIRCFVWDVILIHESYGIKDITYYSFMQIYITC